MADSEWKEEPRGAENGIASWKVRNEQRPQWKVSEGLWGAVEAQRGCGARVVRCLQEDPALPVSAGESLRKGIQEEPTTWRREEKQP